MDARSKNPILTITTLFLVIIIDQMGITFIFPILTPLFMDPVNSIIPPYVSPEMRDILYGFCLALYPFMMFCAAPLLGSLSDQLGRKIILLVCLLGSAISFFLSAVAIDMNSLVLLFISRALAGFFSGSQYIAQAAIADISPPDKKAVNLSYIIVAISIGMIFGPLVGGYLSDPNIAKWMNYATPFEAAAILAILNAILLWILFPETYKAAKKAKIQIWAGFILLKEAFSDQKIRLLSTILFFLVFGWTLYFQSISWYLFQRFNFTGNEIGIFIAYIGIGFAVALMVFLKIFLKYFASLIRIIIICISINTLSIFLAFVVPDELIEWVTAPFIIGTLAIAYTLLLALFSNAVSEDKQGWIMGVTGSLVAIAWTFSGLIAGPLGYMAIILPLLASSVLAFMSLIFAIYYANREAAARR